MTFFSALLGTTGATTTAATGGYWIGIGPQSSAATGYAHSITNSIMQNSIMQTQMLQQYQLAAQYQQQLADSAPRSRHLSAGEYELPDGAKLVIDSIGNYRVLDADAKVVYRANRVREFNPYINASDLLEAFIEEVRKYGVDPGEILNLPIEAFINWIILQAAKRDGDPLENLPSVESALPRARLPALQDEAAHCPNATGVPVNDDGFPDGGQDPREPANRADLPGAE